MKKMTGHVLEIENLTKSFGAAPVLNGVSLTLESGTILGLAGENGAGKSTLARLISGRIKPDSGRLLRNGTCYVLPQEFSLVPTLTVQENIFLGRELVHNGLLQKKAMKERTRELFSKLSFEINPDREVSTLSVAEKQMTEIAKSFLAEANLLILDEPTTVLSRDETRTLLTLLRNLRSRGTAILYISHKLNELLELCDEIAVLRDGVLISRDPSNALTPLQIAARMVGRKLSQVFPEKTPVPEDAPLRFEAKHISSKDGLVKDVSFSIRKGEILGLAGLAGAGRTELAETICGLRKRAPGGEIRIDRAICKAASARAIFDAGLAYLPEDRQGTALLTGEDLTENITLSSLKKYCNRFGFIQKKRLTGAAEEYIRRFRIRCASAQARVSTLSGGNQQKVALAKGLDTNPDVFFFDEPTRGVDVGARREIYDFIHELAADGVSCLLISSDLEELIGNCDRVMVMYEGTLRGEVRGNHVNEEEIMYLATGIR